MQEKPKWLETAPQTPLHAQIYGKQYEHYIFCNASRRMPVGGPMCICLKLLKSKSL